MRWYQGGPELDREIRERFSGAVEAALAGELAAWSRDIGGRVALLLLLDQFTRSIYRDTARAYAGDAEAQRLALEAFDRGLDEGIDHEWHNFLIMPLVHAESVALQERAVAEMERLHSAAPEALRHVYDMGLEQAHKYQEIIARFGRFPHRNAVLGRASTPEETEFLRDWASKAAPEAMRSKS